MTKPMLGDLRLKKRTPKREREREREGSQKVTYTVQRCTGMKFVGTPREGGVWRMTLHRLEWFPQLKTWRLMETRHSKKITGQDWWEQIITADFGNITEEDACSVAISTLRLAGY